MDFRAGVRDRRPAYLAVLVVGVAVALVVLVALAFYAFGAYLYYDSYESGYDYETTITVDRATEDLTLYLPAAQHDGDVVVGDLHLWSYEDRVGDWEQDVLETAHGPMLRVQIDEVTGSDDVSLTARVPVDRSVETRAPRGVEPVLSPMYEVRERPCDLPPGTDEDGCYGFESAAYVEHANADETTIGVQVRHSGFNEWWTLGWSGNSYETTATNFEIGVDPDGDWADLDGRHQEGRGSYGGLLPPPPR